MHAISSENAPQALGPYSQAIRHGNTLYLSGQIPLNPEFKTIEAEDIESQTKQVLNNIRNVLAAADLTLQDIVKTTVYMTDLTEFAAMNQVYEAALNGHRPARSAVQVAALPKDAKIEIECIAVFDID